MVKHRDVILVLLITVLYHTMNQMFVPTFPIYIAERGGDEVLVGLLVGLIPLGSIVAKSFFGKMSTRRSNLLVLRLGLIVATLVILLYFPFWGFGFLALVRLLQSIGLAGYVTGSQGLMAEQTTPANRGFFFGVYAAMIGVGMTAGPLLGSFLAEGFGYKALFGGAALVAGLAAALGFAVGRGPAAAKPGMGRRYQPHPPWKNRRLMIVCGTMVAGAAVLGATSAMLALHAAAVGLGNGSLFFALYALTFTAGGAAAGALSDRLSRTVLIVPGFCLLILGMVFLSVLNGAVVLALAGVTAGLGLGTVNAVLLAMVPGYSINEVDAANDLAFFANAFDLGVVLGSFGFSFLAARSFSLFWLAVAALGVLGLLFYLRHNPEGQGTGIGTQTKQAQV